MSWSKFTNLISRSSICTPFILFLASIKLASTSTAIICNTNEKVHPWRTPCIRVIESDRRPFIFILDWILVYSTLIIQMNFSPYPNSCKSEKTKSQSSLPKTDDIIERFLFRLFDASATSQIRESVFHSFILNSSWFKSEMGL